MNIKRIFIASHGYFLKIEHLFFLIFKSFSLLGLNLNLLHNFIFSSTLLPYSLQNHLIVKLSKFVFLRVFKT